MIFPNFDPVLFSIPVPFTDLSLAIRWYSLAYVTALLLGWRYCLALATRPPQLVTARQIDDFFVWAMAGVVLGGRLGFVLFYRPEFYLGNPLEIFKIWQGGMSFHGGLAGVAVAMIVYARRNEMPLFGLTDLVAAAAPIGQFFGRIANFINGELWGRAVESDVPWAMVFPDPNAGDVARHPSQLYQAGLEGLTLFLVLMWLILGRTRALTRPGFITGAFLAGYAIARIAAEVFREPDTYIGFLAFGTTWGQWLSIPLLIGGIYLIWRALRRAPVYEM